MILYTSLTKVYSINMIKMNILHWICQNDVDSDSDLIQRNAIDSLDSSNFSLLEDNLHQFLEYGDKLLLLKRYQQCNILFGLTCKEAKAMYDYLYKLYMSNRNLNNSYINYIIIFILWYSQSYIYEHCCLNGCCSLLSYIAMKTKSQNAINHSSSRRVITTAIDSIYSILPQRINIFIQNTSQLLFHARWEFLEAFRIFDNDAEKMLIEQCSQIQTKENINERSLVIDDNIVTSVFYLAGLTQADIDFLQLTFNVNNPLNDVIDDNGTAFCFPIMDSMIHNIEKWDEIIHLWNIKPRYLYKYMLATMNYRSSIVGKAQLSLVTGITDNNSSDSNGDDDDGSVIPKCLTFKFELENVDVTHNYKAKISTVMTANNKHNSNGKTTIMTEDTLEWNTIDMLIEKQAEVKLYCFVTLVHSCPYDVACFFKFV